MENPFGIVRKCLLRQDIDLFNIRDEKGHRIAEDLTEIQADFLVTVINNHEKLVNFIDGEIEQMTEELDYARVHSLPDVSMLEQMKSRYKAVLAEVEKK